MSTHVWTPSQRPGTELYSPPHFQTCLHLTTEKWKSYNIENCCSWKHHTSATYVFTIWPLDDAVQAKKDANLKGNFMKSTEGKILFSLIYSYYWYSAIYSNKIHLPSLDLSDVLSTPPSSTESEYRVMWLCIVQHNMSNANHKVCHALINRSICACAYLVHRYVYWYLYLCI